MRDPLAPKLRDPYCLLGLPSDATPAEAEAALDAYNKRSRGNEMEAIDAWDAIHDPTRRLAVDIFRYRSAEPTTDFPCELERIRRWMDTKAQELAAELDFGSPKPVIEVAELSLLKEA